MKPSSFESLLTKVGPDDNSVQFSFVSKLFHTLKNDEPIYDRYVREFLGVESPSGKKSENRQMAAVEIYEEKIVKGFYKNNDYDELRALMLKLFGEKFPNVKGVSENKKLDFICWALGKKGYKIMEFIR